MPRKYATIGGAATLVHHRGATTLPDRPPHTSQGACVLCLHDAGAAGGRFDDLLDALAERHSPISFDQPGHGRSAGLDSLGSIEAMAEHLHELCQSWSLPPAVLIGEGMGAQVAMQFAADHPEAVSGLILLGAIPPADLDNQISALEQITAGRARREFDRSGYAPETDRKVYQKAFADWVKTDPRATLGDRRGQRDWPGVGDLAVPVVVVLGEHQEDPGTEEVAERFSQAKVHRLEGAGRHGVLEQPEAVAAVVDELVASISRGGQE